ncbi:Uncharacterized protein HZ326_30115 [Fusarium oxysporum f. sp. albedinis]|nr:Uncharacterized protein HZ326_30115 [Fusarium oxysporum f. sp. albedinis]
MVTSGELNMYHLVSSFKASLTSNSIHRLPSEQLHAPLSGTRGRRKTSGQQARMPRLLLKRILEPQINPRAKPTSKKSTRAKRHNEGQ